MLDIANVSGVTRVENPYRPGFNQSPRVLAGRDAIIAAAQEALDVAALDGRTPRPLVLVGSRGVGKTVLLGELASVAAERYGWLTAHAEVRPRTPFTAQLVERLDAAHELLQESDTGRRFEISMVRARLTAFGIGGEIGVRRTPTPPADALALERSLTNACNTAIERETGLVLSIDEIQLAGRPELGDLAAVLQQHVPDNWPLVVVIAGLPTIRDPHRSVTYLERGEWHELGVLEHADTLLAFAGPATAAGRPLDDDAAALLANASGGYPYAVQVFGHHAWRASTGSPRITIGHVRDALPRAEADLSTGLYASRWNDASPKEQEYLAAVARLTTTDYLVTGSEVARFLDAQSREVSYLRDRLLKKGSLVAQGRTLEFPVPGMADWINEHTSTS